jgi:hypothetical protein
MDRFMIGKYRIPVIPEQLDGLKEHLSVENLDRTASYVQNNKHNQVT